MKRSDYSQGEDSDNIFAMRTNFVIIEILAPITPSREAYLGEDCADAPIACFPEEIPHKADEDESMTNRSRFDVIEGIA